MVGRLYPERNVSIPGSYASHKGIDSEAAWLPEDLKGRLRERIKYELEMFGYEY